MTCVDEYFHYIGLGSLALLDLFLSFPSGDETETDSEVEDRVDGIKSWLSKNKATGKTLSDEGSLKSARLVLTSLVLHDR